MPKPKIFITRNIPQPALDRLAEVFDISIHANDKAIGRQQLMQDVKDMDALLCLLTDSIDKELLEAAPRLKCVSNLAVGFNNIDLEYARSRNIAVCNTPGVLTETTADLTWALLLACARRVVEADNYARSGRFEGWEPLLMLGVDVFSKTLGIIGMGRIGSAVARRAEGFGMKVLWFDPQVDPKTVSDKYERADLRHLCSSSDFISIHVPLTPDTHHLVNSELLSLMRPTAVLINTARGPIVDEEALIKALRDKKIAAAGLDVFENEPEIPAELLELENAVLLPHIGSASIETRTKMALMAAENAIAVIQGTEPPARVN
ncbi:MAG TPA: D-glycerate dehydrogenase [Candidatus Syntrophosphaera sp.]|jgi:glyoxylate reductase|nr:MAG: putative 2-hydroxyacid dehydrogenase [Candidatus Cloacimonetes bacterium ADurb.Bin117]HNU54133.1 D-glycerate dehydrogenase [Candidatus Syntrophosphaera sp.]HOH47792.1 D-glycerate dehydrogenase [Candidatus Syntrophosphaera sp.]HOU73079.1 D-glycerate dehydrogenase [Candidatus Syntrophosphaera sp.]HPB43110.1 D-glycerate dehydrogenase [Candidatus Syntrophosphaera sp.]